MGSFAFALWVGTIRVLTACIGVIDVISCAILLACFAVISSATSRVACGVALTISFAVLTYVTLLSIPIVIGIIGLLRLIISTQGRWADAGGLIATVCFVAITGLLLTVCTILSAVLGSGRISAFRHALLSGLGLAS